MLQQLFHGQNPEHVATAFGVQVHIESIFNVLFFQFTRNSSHAGVVRHGNGSPATIFIECAFQVFTGSFGCFFNMITFVHFSTYFEAKLFSCGRH